MATAGPSASSNDEDFDYDVNGTNRQNVHQQVGETAANLLHFSRTDIPQTDMPS
jgi:hypothetical protein